MVALFSPKIAIPGGKKTVIFDKITVFFSAGIVVFPRKNNNSGGKKKKKIFCQKKLFFSLPELLFLVRKTQPFWEKSTVFFDEKAALVF